MARRVPSSLQSPATASSLGIVTTIEQGSARRSERRQDLVDAQAGLMAVLGRVGDDDWSNESPNEGWTIRDLLVHLATAERGFVPTLRRVAAGQGGVPDDFDPNRWNAGQLKRQAGTTAEQLLETLVTSHQEMLAFLDETDETALEQRGRVGSGGDDTLANGLRLVARHKRGHTADIEAALAR